MTDVEYNEAPEGESRIGATNSFKTAVANYIATLGNSISLHSADPGLVGSAEISGGGYARKTTNWTTATIVSGGANNGRAQITGSVLQFDVPGGVAINFYGVWNGTTFLYGKPLAPGATLTAAGRITITPTHAYGLL